MTAPVRAVLFDLDGTLIDSAPDLAGTGNEIRQARGLAPLPFAQFRPMVGAGARGMLGIALQVTPEHAEFADLRDEFLRRYELRMTRETRPFEAVPALLDSLEARGLVWGIVTNKIERFTLPLVQSFGWNGRAGAVVGGDTTPHSKPHPAPLLEAARRMAVDPSECIYVGDDLRDVQAGRAAGMRTVAAAWGYLGSGEAVTAWGADQVIDEPSQLLKLLPMP
jgi:N-acetyl-D-muramate 6-phosphate phosphatase